MIMIFLQLINNITLLLTLSILYSLIARKWDYSSLWHHVLAGILFGLVTVTGMLNPLILEPGVIFDGRSIILSIGGLFGGPITATISAVISITYRIYLGGAGSVMGVSVIISSSLIGVIYYYIRKKYPNAVRIGYLYLFGIIVHLNMLTLTLTLPSNLTDEVLKAIFIPVITIFPLGSLLICQILLFQETRRTAIDLLRKSEENYRLLVEKASSSIIKLDRLGRILFVNSFAQDTFGYKPEELIGKFAVGSIVDKNKRNIREFANLVDELFKNPEKHPSLETQVLCKNGEIKWISWTYKVIQEDNYNLWELLCIGNDITAKKNAELELIESEERYRTIIELAADTIILGDYKGDIIAANLKATELTGYSTEELIGRNISTLFLNNEIVNKPLRYDLLLEGKVIMIERTILRKDGTAVVVEMNSKRMPHNTYISMMRDVTERINNEKILIESEQQLRKQNEEYLALNEELNESNLRIRDINEKLIKVTEKAQESDKLKTAFLANMSHEIRTPMNGIVGFCGLLERPDITKIEQKKYVEIITKSSFQLLSIINDIIDYSRIETGQITFNKSNFDIEQIITDVFNLFQETANQKNVNLVLALPNGSNLKQVYSDEYKIKQILGNLVNNAIKFTEKGNVEMGYLSKDGCIEIFVKDEGIGIDQDNHTMIFERFRQVEGANISSNTGTGLGLAISKSLVEKMDGRIWVESTKGKGATFYFTIPQA
jgi:PAS domain S-box-containing protein